MKKLFLLVLLTISTSFANAQSKQQDDKTYYQYALFSEKNEDDPVTGKVKCFIYFYPGDAKKGYKYKDKNGKTVCFDCWAACLNYLSLEGWEFFENIEIVSSVFQQCYVRKKISKEELKKMVDANTYHM